MTFTTFETFQIETDQTGLVTIDSSAAWEKAVRQYGVAPAHTKERLLMMRKVAACQTGIPCFTFWGSGSTLNDWAKENKLIL